MGMCAHTQVYTCVCVCLSIAGDLTNGYVHTHRCVCAHAHARAHAYDQRTTSSLDPQSPPYLRWSLSLFSPFAGLGASGNSHLSSHLTLGTLGSLTGTVI